MKAKDDFAPEPFPKNNLKNLLNLFNSFSGMGLKVSASICLAIMSIAGS
jgi:hypothetical protein